MKMISSLILVISLTTLGCDSTGQGNLSSDRDAASNSPYLVDSEPTGVISVGEARAAIEDGQDVTLVGLIGGSTDPFVEGLAAFTIVDAKVPYCAPEEGCPTPWDYCCTQDQVKDNIATVKIVNEVGKPVAQDARSLLGVTELSSVVVKGKAQRDDQGNLTVAATQVFVRPSP